MKNNYFSYKGQYYHQIRGGAMGSPLTLTVANCYTFFYEQQIIKQIHNSSGLYFRYIDDISIAINWPARHLFKQIDKWNHFDENIKLSENIAVTADFLDLHIENKNRELFTTIYQKPSYEPYYLPFNSIHPLHMKKNIIFTLLLRALRYCSTFQEYLNERERLRVALLLNKYPNKFIDERFIYVLEKLNIEQFLTSNNYAQHRQKIIDSQIKEKVPIDFGKIVFVHFTYCSNMRTFSGKFHALWNEYFGESPINDIIPTLGTRNVNNLQQRLMHTRSNKNYQILSKRVELDLPPKIIEKVDFSFKIDESIISQDEAQATYNQMRQITKDFRTQAMTLYVQSACREYEILSNEIKGVVERFPQDNDDGFDAEPGYAAFKQYHELREKRMKLEIEQSMHFLSEQQVEGDTNNLQIQEEIIAPTVIRSLGEDFLLQQ
ncbi:unnamed protein product [Rotaria sp. Silwood2]|nr:unnamed protein product [Rotaria sp. Silwood2]